ncbi:MMPL family transporter [Nocardioides bigeumensis]|uniref:MMPL family transporter n=2 Tax=Nocardioides bigeumensis TaxID=433657 RepID=A0ABN2YEU5_9ACTN
MFLFRLGGKIARHRGLVVAFWILVLAALIGGNRTLGTDYDDTFVLPGASSQAGQDVLAERFGLTGTNGQVLVTATSGKITDQANSDEVAKLAKKISDVDEVAAGNPLEGDYALVSDDEKHTIIQVRFVSQNPDEDTLDEVTHAATPPSGSTVETSIGGDAYKGGGEPSKIPELLGLLVSFLILAVTFGSFLAAGMPILTSMIGVGITLSGVVIVTHATTVSSSAPTLAEMLGLAVGIDYALFILSRHRRNLAEGHSPTESMSRALATAGSAVVFAGATVVIALCGLTVAGIPVLTVMGLAAAAAVSVAVTLALTLLPAIALLLGERLRPKMKAPKEEKPRKKKAAAPPKAKVGFAERWVSAVTKVPLLTIAAVLVILGIATIPATQLDLALPDNSTAPEDTSARQTYDGITEAFGAGYNSPLSVTANIITSTDPTKTVDDLAKKVQDVPDVVHIMQATPNPGADTGLVALVPKDGQTAESTATLVQALRDRSAQWEEELGVTDILIAGTTAVNIDVSKQLADALLPFAAIVMGLSVILLMIVFRSLAVPIKATLGYLLSVGAALGSVVAAFQWGWLDAVMGESAGPIVSFLPIFVMGVLFGLAMDYEMFLVSAMREEFVVSGNASEAIHHGFKASSKVVTAAAMIMTSVFIAFIPGGSATIKPIALGLAIGVAVDAFVVRMTLVPAVLMLLGRGAWWLPAWLERALPEVDVEGAALHRKVAYEDWAADRTPTAVFASELVVAKGAQPLDIVAPLGEVTRVVAPKGADERTLANVLAGRTRPSGGELVVDGLLLPEQREQVNRVASVVDLTGSSTEAELEQRIRATARLSSGSRRARREQLDRTVALVGELKRAIGSGSPHTMRSALVDAAQAVASGVRTVVITGLDALLLAQDRHRTERLADALAGHGLAVVLLLTHAGETAAPTDPPGSRETDPREKQEKQEKQEKRAVHD